MDKITLTERPGWREAAQELGFTFADMHGEPYWDETSAYAFSLEELETRIEDPATEIHAMVREAVAKIVVSEELMTRSGLPRAHWDLVERSWAAGEPELYGRMDLAYDGAGPAKLLEYNADTPTSLYESASFQWQWLEECRENGTIPAEADQFNGIHEALVERFGEIFEPGAPVHFTAMSNTPEDYATVEALAWAAREAGLGAHYTDLEKISLSKQGQFLDAEDRVIGNLFKLYPWEDLLGDDFAQHLQSAGCRFVEPPWKAVVSNKAILPVLWQMFEGHPNLLPAFFAADAAEALTGGAAGLPSDAFDPAIFARAQEALALGHVTKPIFSREGAAVTIREAGEVTEAAPGQGYEKHPMILQQYCPLPVFHGFRPVIGAWIVGQACVGMGLREDRARITQDLSRFKPHFIID